MRDHQMLEPDVYSRYEDILHKMPDDGLFYPKSMNVNTKAYTYDDKVNLIDQLIVANHVMEMGHKPDKLIAFLKKSSALGASSPDSMIVEHRNQP